MSIVERGRIKHFDISVTSTWLKNLELHTYWHPLTYTQWMMSHTL